MAAEIGISDESVTVPLSRVSPKAMVGAISEGTSATILARTPVRSDCIEPDEGWRFWKSSPAGSEW